MEKTTAEAGWALTQLTTAVSTPSDLGGGRVEVETLAVLRITSAWKERETATVTLTAVETCDVGLTTAMVKALTILMTVA